MLNKMKLWWSDTWTVRISSCIQSCMEPLFASWRIQVVNQCRLLVLMKQPTLKCVIVLAGRIRSPPKYTGFTPIKCPRHRLQVCLSPLVRLSFVESATFCSLSAWSWVSRSCSASVRSRCTIISARGTVERMFRSSRTNWHLNGPNPRVDNRLQ